MKKVISILMIMVLLVSVLAVSAFATESGMSEYYDKLDALCWSAVYDYGVSSNNRDCPYKYEPGVLVISLTNESLKKGREALEETSEFLDGYTVDPDSYTFDAFENQYAKLKGVLDTLVVSKGSLRSLINFCAKEKNHDGYYDEELWTQFVEKLNYAQVVYDDNTIVEDYEITECYFELLHSHFKLCSSNQMFGDIDNNGEISVLDATHLQRALARTEDLNSSQKLISKSDILYATQIQRHIAKLDATLYIENSTLDSFVIYTEYSNIHSQNFKFKSWKYDYFYVSDISDHNYPIYL